LARKVVAEREMRLDRRVEKDGAEKREMSVGFYKRQQALVRRCIARSRVRRVPAKRRVATKSQSKLAASISDDARSE
jgi:hypothetical protein